MCSLYDVTIIELISFLHGFLRLEEAVEMQKLQLSFKGNLLEVPFDHWWSFSDLEPINCF